MELQLAASIPNVPRRVYENNNCFANSPCEGLEALRDHVKFLCHLSSQRLGLDEVKLITMEKLEQEEKQRTKDKTVRGSRTPQDPDEFWNKLETE
jgi:hypothetical protein